MITSRLGAIVLIFLVLSTSALLSQNSHQGWGTFRPLTTACEPCQFPSGNWDTLNVITQVIYLEGCTFQVKFKKRICGPDGCQELKVLSITPTNPVPCNAIDEDLLPTLVVGRMVITNSMGFWPDTAKPGANGCWRIVRPRCWRKLTATGPDPCSTLENEPDQPVGTFLPCDPNECCTNVMYPTLPDCGVTYVYYEPKGEDYLHIHRKISLNPNTPEEDIVAADLTFLKQFTDKVCDECAEQGSNPPTVGPHPRCHESCSESIIEQYNDAVAEQLRRKYNSNN